MQRRLFSGFVFFRILKFIVPCFIVAKCDLVHDVGTKFHLRLLLTPSGNLLCNMSNTRETANFRINIQDVLAFNVANA